MNTLFAIIDYVVMPFSFISAILLRNVRRAGFHRMRMNKSLLLNVGVIPVITHYYEPAFDPRHLRKSLRADRHLPGIDLNASGQLSFLKQFNFKEELKRLPMSELGREVGFQGPNTTFGPGDADFLYNMVRQYRPKRIVEIGSGFSTLVSRAAIRANQAGHEGYSCELTCIEPYEAPWLEKTEANVVRKRVEDMDLEFFQQLETNDILFIDSSHVVRPQGDVLFEYLEILPLLQPGVFVHVHDIFTPRDYPDSWIKDEMRLWNEQYLLESFLTFNTGFKIVGALNYLKHNHLEALSAACPYIEEDPAREPGSIWLQRA